MTKNVKINDNYYLRNYNIIIKNSENITKFQKTQLLISNILMKYLTDSSKELLIV